MNLKELRPPQENERGFALVHESTEWSEVLCAFGDLDLSCAGELQSAITRYVNGRLPLVIDLEFCDYLDSTVLRVLVRAFRTSPERLGIIVPQKARIARIFEMTSLDRTLGVAKSRADARERFSA
jgi:anti-anti-sigma factor